MPFDLLKPKFVTAFFCFSTAAAFAFNLLDFILVDAA
jgi:hypothetical protein